MNNTLTDIGQLRNNMNFASISQFFHTFQSAFRPWPVTTHDIIYSRNLDANEYVFETEDLERMILDPSERIRLEDLLVRLLRLATGKRFINTSTWQTHFSKEFEKRQFDEENPLIAIVHTESNGEAKEEVNGAPATTEAVNFFTLPLDTRVYLLHLLCEWQLDEPDKFREHLDSEEDAAQWRVDPIGFDKKGGTFWLFDDNRLYKETPKPKVSKKKKTVKKKRAPPPPPPPSTRRSSRRNQPVVEEPVIEEEESEDEEEWMPWKLMCCTKYEWEQIPLKYANSKNIDEQRFHTLLVNDLIPKIIPVMEEREKEIKKQEALMHRKRSSRIMIKELEALERASSHEPEMDQLIAQPAAAAGKGRASNRIEKKALEKEQREQELAAKAREERALERERRIAEREYRALARERRQESEDPFALVNNMLKSEPPVAVTSSPTTVTIKMTVKDKKDKDKKEDKPKRKYVKKPKFDENGNPIPRKPKLDQDGNPIPLKKRGRKPKNKSLDEENWIFDCVCGVFGKNLDDGTPMIACEKCGVWQHIKCLQNSGQVEKRKNMDDVAFVCRPCESQVVDIDGNDKPQPKKLKVDHVVQPMDYQRSPQQYATQLLPPQQQPLYPQQHHYLQPLQHQQPVSWQQPSAVRDAYYPPQPPPTSVLPPMRPPSLSTIHNLINSITPPSRDPCTPSSTIAEPPTPPTVHQQVAQSTNTSITQQQQVPVSKLSVPINDHKYVHVAPSTASIVQQQSSSANNYVALNVQKPTPVTPIVAQQQLTSNPVTNNNSEQAPAVPFIQQTAQSPVSTVRAPVAPSIKTRPVIQPPVSQTPPAADPLTAITNQTHPSISNQSPPLPAVTAPPADPIQVAAVTTPPPSTASQPNL